MSLFKKLMNGNAVKNTKAVSNLYHVQGILSLKPETPLMVEIDDEAERITVSFLHGFKSDTKLTIDFDNFIDAESNTIDTITEKNKSVVKRAIVGTILPFGLIGTAVGAMSGIGSKTHKKTDRILTISYKVNDKVKHVSFMEGKMTQNYDKLASKLEQING